MEQTNDIYRAEYNNAIALLSIPSKENINKAYEIMKTLATENNYMPAIQWMANYNENVLGDYKEATYWYKNSLEHISSETPKDTEPTNNIRGEIIDNNSFEFAAKESADTMGKETDQLINANDFMDDSYSDNAGKHEASSAKKNRKGTIWGMAVLLAVLLGLGTWCYFVLFQGVKELTLEPSTIELNRGESKKITATILPEKNQNKATIEWSSSDDEVAIVDDEGIITAVGEGTCTITARVGRKTSNCETRVYQVKSLNLSTKQLVMAIGESITITASIFPDQCAGTKVDWSSSNSEIVKVDSNGVATAIGAGQCTIVATADDITAYVNVTVTSITEEEKAIVGKWIVYGGKIDGEFIDLNGTYLPLILHDDHTGNINLGDDSHPITWEFNSPAEEQGCFWYTLTFSDKSIYAWLLYDSSEDILMYMLYDGNELTYSLFYYRGV